MASRLPRPRKHMKYPELWMHKESGDLILHYDNGISIRYRDSEHPYLNKWARDILHYLVLDAWDAGFMLRDDRKADTKHFIFIGELK